MKKWIPLAVILIVSIAALVVSEMRREGVSVSPRSLLNFIADTQREATRLPMRLTRLSDAEEIAIGDRQAESILYRFPGKENEEFAVRQAYIEKVGASIAIRAQRKLPYRLHYIPDPNLINAFALPGGHIFVGEGLLALLDTEDQLAAVLGHEIIHIDRYHCAERIQVQAQARKVPLGGLMALPLVVFQAGYTKAQELESDRDGTFLAVRAGYSPYGAIEVFETFESLRHKHIERRARSPQEEMSQVALQTLTEYFRTHPLPAERITQIQSLIQQQNWTGLKKMKPLQIKFAVEKKWNQE